MYERRALAEKIRFDRAFEVTLGYEGGYVNDPLDPGGETQFGISKRSYPHLDIAALTVADARRIYYRDYWEKLGLHNVQSDVIAGEIFDTAVNMGRRAAARIVQESVNFLGGNLAVDGIIGSATIAAINAWASKDERAFYITLNGFQFMRYVQIVEKMPDKVRFSRGWTKRIQQYREE